MMRCTIALLLLSSYVLSSCLLSSCGIAACSNDDSTASHAAKIKPLPKAEVLRAHKACDAYLARVCACAKEHPELAPQCDLAKGLPSGLQLNLDLLDSSGLKLFQLKAAKAAARKIAAGCFESDARLDTGKCPRVNP